MRNITVLTAIILAALMVPTGIYAFQNPRTGINLTNPEEVALSYIKDGPTFSFDGITSTLKVTKFVILESYPLKNVVTIEFQSLHSGYGDRADDVLLQVITPHTAVVTVVEGKVVSAVLDGEWNEVEQRPINNDDAKPFIEDIAFNWLVNAPTFKFDGVEGSAKVTGSFLAMTFAAPSFWGVTIEFDSLHAGYGDRSGQILAQVITHHVVMVHVTDGAVKFAEIDGTWDEVNQRSIKPLYTIEGAEATALEWLYGCTTFRFDGIPETVKVQKIITLRMPNAWVVYIDFTCNYPGYGNRTGHLMLGHSQEHTIKISLLAGQVTQAVIDEVWDEMNQVMLDSKPGEKLVNIEEARDIAFNFVVGKFGLKDSLPTVWMVEDLTPQGVLGVQVTRYTFSGWSVTIKNAVVWKPTYSVSIEKGSEVSWTGEVDQSGNVIEAEGSEPSVPEFIYTPEIARKMCIEYLMTLHPEVKAQPPKEWETINLVPEGIVGLTKVQYTGGGWTITVTAPVVWKPTYTVSVSYSGPEIAFTWSGVLPQGGPVEETIFK